MNNLISGGQKIKYEAYSDTVRLMPQNYCLAYREGHKWFAYNDHAVKPLWGLVAVVCWFVNLGGR